MKKLFIIANVLLIINFGLTQESIKNDDLTQAIRQEFKSKSGLTLNNVLIDTDNGVVTLSGYVSNLLARESAVEIVKSIKGVRSIINRTEVKAIKRSDYDIFEDIRKSLKNDQVIEQFDIEIQVRDGRVVLYGTVSSWQEKQLVGELAKSVIGVKEVENKINIRYNIDRQDQEIKRDIQNRLESDVRIRHQLLDVHVRNQIVQLVGTVGSMIEKSWVIRDAWVTGVDSVDADHLEVKWWARDEIQNYSEYVNVSDEKIKSAVTDALYYDPRVANFNIQVLVNDGIVTLKGKVNNLYAKRSAENDAKNTIGVWRVQNMLEIEFDSPYSDEDILVMVKDALEENSYFQKHEINVSVYDGKVILYGNVNSSLEKQQIEKIVPKIKGITHIENNLKIKRKNPKSDRDIKTAIKQNLYWNPHIDEDKINIVVIDGTATLTGKVEEYYQKSYATEEAIDAGALTVHNNIKVQYGIDAEEEITE